MKKEDETIARRIKVGEVVVDGAKYMYWGTREMWDAEKEGSIRNSKHKKLDREGKRLLDLLEETRWFIYKGNTRRKEEKKFTYAGIGDTVIDYILAEEIIRVLIVRM